jgi:hypothetical protein
LAERERWPIAQPKSRTEMMNMNNTLNQLMEKNLLEVFGERDSARRKIAINAIYTENCTFFETFRVTPSHFW